MEFTLEQNIKNSLPSEFYKEVKACEFKKPELIAYNHSLSEFLNLPNISNGALIFSGQNTQAIAMAYSGHQFGHFVPLLGDGRAKLLGSTTAKDGMSYEIQLKGSGKTPFSRPGSDGLSSLGPVLREYIVSEAMHKLGVPTTRALACVSTGEFVHRQNLEPGGVFTRVSRSHLRVGSFEYAYSNTNPKILKQLTEYCCKYLYPEASTPLELFQAICNKQIQLVAKWMSIGFIHGVMNTDNTSIAGETLDYGPCAFLDEFNFNQKFSYIDQNGRYNYIQQPPILQWNLSLLAQCLQPLVPDRQNQSFQDEVHSITERVETLWIESLSQKLGFQKDNLNIVKIFLKLLHENQLDYTLSFRHLSDFTKTSPKASDLYFIKTPEAQHNYIEFIKLWQQEHKNLNTNINSLTTHLNQINPLYIPRNHLIQQVITEAFQGNFDTFHSLNKTLEAPYTFQKNTDFHFPPTEDNRITTTFCGT